MSSAVIIIMMGVMFEGLGGGGAVYEVSPPRMSAFCTLWNAGPSLVQPRSDTVIKM